MYIQRHSGSFRVSTKLSSLFLSLALILTRPLFTHAATPNAPYLYYYADTLSAFVIERADGTDSRVLGAGLIPPAPAHYTVDGAGWSPSGKWFAWTMYHDARPEGAAIDPTGAAGYIMSADGNKLIPLLKNVVIYMTWSPTADLLFVAYVNEAADISDLVLIDANRGIKLISLFGYSDIRWDWSPDGKFIALSYFRGNTPVFVIVTDKGTVSAPRQGESLSWSPEGWLSFFESGKNIWHFEKPTTGEHFDLDVPPHSQDFYWNPLGQYALISVLDSDSETVPVDLYLLSLSTHHMTLIAQKVQATLGWSPGGHWLAYQLWGEDYIALFNPGTQVTQQTAIEPGQTTPYWVWLPASDRLYVEDGTDSEKHAWEFNPETSTSISVYPVEGDPSYLDFSPSGRYVYEFYSRAVLNLSNGDRISTATHSSNVAQTNTAIWDKTENWLIRGDNQTVSGGGWGFDRFGVTNSTGTFWRELGGCYPGPVCAGWVPDTVKLSSGAPVSVLLAPENREDHVQSILGFNSPDSLDCNLKTPHELLLTVGKLHYTLHTPTLCTPFDSTSPNTAISTDGKLLATSDDYVGITLWDLKRGLPLGTVNSFGYEMTFSADDTHLTARSRAAVLTWDISKIPTVQRVISQQP
jgi:hypothetical protein